MAHPDVYGNHILHALRGQQDRAGPPTAFDIHHPSQTTDVKLLVEKLVVLAERYILDPIGFRELSLGCVGGI